MSKATQVRDKTKVILLQETLFVYYRCCLPDTKFSLVGDTEMKGNKWSYVH